VHGQTICGRTSVPPMDLSFLLKPATGFTFNMGMAVRTGLSDCFCRTLIRTSPSLPMIEKYLIVLSVCGRHCAFLSFSGAIVANQAGCNGGAAPSQAHTSPKVPFDTFSSVRQLFDEQRGSARRCTVPQRVYA